MDLEREKLGELQKQMLHAHFDADHDRRRCSDRSWHVLLRLVANHSCFDSVIDIKLGRSPSRGTAK